MTFRRLPVDVEAQQWWPSARDPAIRAGRPDELGVIHQAPHFALGRLGSPDGPVVRPGDYIVTEPGRGLQVYPPAVFEANFVPVSRKP